MPRSCQAVPGARTVPIPCGEPELCLENKPTNMLGSFASLRDRGHDRLGEGQAEVTEIDLQGS